MNYEIKGTCSLPSLTAWALFRHKGRSQITPKTCPLTSTYMPATVTHMGGQGWQG